MFPEKKKMKNTGKLISTCIRDDQGYFVKAVTSEALSVENLATFFSNKRLCLLIVVNMESWRVSGRIGVMLFLSKVLAVYFEVACPHF